MTEVYVHIWFCYEVFEFKFSTPSWEANKVKSLPDIKVE